MTYSDDFQEMIKKYNEELRKMKTKAKPETENDKTVLVQTTIQNTEPNTLNTNLSDNANDNTTANPNIPPNVALSEQQNARSIVPNNTLKNALNNTQTTDENNAKNNVQSISPSILETLTPEEREELNEAQRFPFTNDYDLPNIKPDEMIKGQYDNLSGMGKLVVRVFTANQAAPVKNASVLVSLEKADGDHLINSVKTNVDGETPVLDLPTVSFEESQTPEVKNPYASYRIRVSAPDFFTIDSINVPIFDKQTAIQPVEMLPIPNGFEGDRVLNSNDTGPINLQ